MYDYQVAQAMAEERRKTYEREAEIHRWLREAGAFSHGKRRAALSSRVLYGVGRLMVWTGRRLQRPYWQRVKMGV
jgi:hypothetical protein